MTTALRRRQSTPTCRFRGPACQPLPHSIDALDLSTASSIQKLASLRILVLSYLADLEVQLSSLESPDVESWKVKGELTIEEFIRTTLDMLEDIRSDVTSHLPELHLADMSHLLDIPDVRAHFPEMPDVLSDVRSRLPSFDQMRSRLDDVYTKFHDIDFRKPLNYIPILSDHIQNLHSHLSSMELATEFPSKLSDLLDSLLATDLLLDPADHADPTEHMIERAARDVADAVKRSFEGVHLIKYTDLPEKWRNNPFVVHGYRFIPIRRWPLIIMSLFALHNETLNIHTHLIPFILWSINLIPYLNTSKIVDTPEILFTVFALLCLLCSSVWHTMAGCAHSASMEFCARVDYVGIGWLISASVGTVVHYGFQCHPTLRKGFLALCFLTGAAGNVLPFMKWFNEYEYRGFRVLFFLSLAFSSVAPLAAMAHLHSTQEMLAFISPVIPSLVSYITGLVFYVSHVPERFLPERWCRKLDVVGGGSHCIWHCFIVLAVSQHKSAIRLMRDGIQCPASGP